MKLDKIEVIIIIDRKIQASTSNEHLRITMLKIFLLQVVLISVLVNYVSGYYVVSLERESELFPLSDDYDEIELHLIDHVESDNLETNMREAKRWYHDEVLHSSNKVLDKAVKLFISLDDMRKCTGESFRIIEGNDYLTGYSARNRPTSRVEKIIDHYAKDHARECLPKYPEILRQKYEKVGDLITSRAHALTDAILYKDPEYSGELLYKVVEKMTRDDPDRKYLGRRMNPHTQWLEFNEEKLRDLYNKYVVDACRKFVALNDDELLQARRYDQEWVYRRETDRLMLDFEDRYWACNSIIGSDSERLFKDFRYKASFNH